MMRLIRWGLAAGLSAGLGLYSGAQAQSRGDTGGPTPTDKGRASAESQTTPRGGAAGTSSDSGMRSDSTGMGAGGTASSGQSGQGKIDKGLQERLQRLHAINQAEMQMGELGSQKAQSAQVKQFAEQLRSDHQRADEKLTQAAQAAGYGSLQGEKYDDQLKDARKDIQKLQSKTGPEFDTAFTSRLVDEHKNAVKETEKAAKEAQKANDPQLASTLQQIQAGMQGHLAHAKQLEESARSEQRAQGRRPPGAGGMGSSSQGGSGTDGSHGAAGTPSGSGQRTTK